MRHQGCLALALCALGCSPSPLANGGSDMATCEDRTLPPYGVVTDDRNVYWGTVDGTIWRSTHPGSDPQALVRLPDPSMGGLFLRGMDLDAQALYVAAGTGDIWRVPLDGAPPTVLANDPGGAEGVAVTPDYVYFTGDDGLVRVPATGGDTLLVVPAGPTGVGCAGSAAASPSYLYFVDFCYGALYREPIPLGSAAVVDRAPMQFSGSHQVVTVAAGYAYWHSSDATIKRTPVSFGPPVTVTTTSPNVYVQGIAVDADAVYWIESNSYPSTATLRRAPLSGGAAESLATVAHEGAIALGPSVVYIADGSHCLTVVPR